MPCFPFSCSRPFFHLLASRYAPLSSVHVDRFLTNLQVMPRFVIQRSLFEVREKPSKAYSWIAFIFAKILVEIPYQVFLAVLAWAAWCFPMFGFHNSSEESGLMLLFLIEFMAFSSTFAQMVIAVLPHAETAGNVATLFFSMMLMFNGVLQTPDALPATSIAFIYRKIWGILSCLLKFPSLQVSGSSCAAPLP